jgi:hypothetical protein
MHLFLVLTLLGLAGVAPAHADVPPGDYRAAIYVDGDRAGTAHFSRRENGGEQIDQVDSEVSIEFLGLDVFEFDQNVRQEWTDGRLQSLDGRTNDDGDVFVTSLQRSDDGALSGTLNDRPVTLPADAFPISVWHYEITRRDTLFDVKDLELREVEVARATDTLEVDGRTIETERFDFSKGWDATVWYDEQQRLVRFRYTRSRHEIVVVPNR